MRGPDTVLHLYGAHVRTYVDLASYVAVHVHAVHHHSVIHSAVQSYLQVVVQAACTAAALTKENAAGEP